MPGPGDCNAALNIYGTHFWCTENAPHVGLAHSNPDAHAIWVGTDEADENTAAWAKADPEGER